MEANKIKADDKQIFDEAYNPEFLWGVLRILFYEAASTNNWEHFTNQMISILSHETYKEVVEDFIEYKKNNNIKLEGELNG